MRRRGPGGAASDGNGGVDDEEQFRARIAWLYHVEGMTQQQIARKLHQNRLRVLRALAAAREDGLVDVRINSKLVACVALESRLERAFALARAIVVPTPSAPGAEVSAVIGLALGHYLSQRLRSGQTIGVGWGRTLQASLRAIAPQGQRGLTVVSLLGGLTRATATSPYEFAWRLSNILDADCYYVAAPIFTSDAGTRRSLMGQRGLAELFARAARSDIAVVSVGDMSTTSTIAALGLVERRTWQALRRAGAVGDLLGHYLAADGTPVDHPINDRVMAYDPRRLRAIKEVVLASGGLGKVPILRAALALARPRVLITDEATAARLLEPAPARASALRA